MGRFSWGARDSLSPLSILSLCLVLSVHSPQPGGLTACQQHQSQVLGPLSQWHQPLQVPKEPGTCGQPCLPLPWGAEQSQERPQSRCPWTYPKRGPPAQPRSAYPSWTFTRYQPCCHLHCLALPDLALVRNLSPPSVGLSAILAGLNVISSKSPVTDKNVLVDVSP